MHRSLALLVALLLAACASAPRPTLAPLQEAAERIRGGDDDPRALALAGWGALFDGGDAATAAARTDEALARDPGEPWALLLRAELASRQLDPAAELEAWIAILQAAPRHPLAILAAGALDRFDGRSPELAERVRQAAEALLADARVEGEVRVRVRGALRRSLRGAGAEAFGPLVAESGIVTAGSVVGPLSDWHFLEAEQAFAPEARAPVEERYEGRSLRPFAFPTGSISLRGEEPEGDVYYVLVRAEVAEGGRYALRLATASSTAAAVAIDGAPLLERRVLDGPAATVVTRAIELAPGSHLVALRVVRGRGPGSVQLALAPVDGSPAPIAYRAAMPGDLPGTPPRQVEDAGLRLATDPAALADALVAEGGVVGLWAAALHIRSIDVQAARSLVDRALEAAPRSTPLLALRAGLLRRDATLPDRIAAARAARDRDALLALDPAHARALLGRARMLADGGRWEEALAAVDEAAAAAPASSAPALERARIALARGFDGQALSLARPVGAAGGDRCAGLRLVHELARRADAVAEEEAAALALLGCGDGRPRLAALHAARGRRAEAIELARVLLAENPQDAGAAHRLADLLAAEGALEEAIGILEVQEAYWPRNAWLPRRRAELLERSGDRAGARAARERALSLEGGDLGLRRMLALEAGRELLGDLRRDGLEVVRRFEAAPRSFDTPAAILLDHGAVEVYPDGSYVELVHTVTRVVDKRGIERFGEVHLPPGAEVLHLRTIKPDGRVLVPETIHGKDSISMPNLAVGDCVEVEYRTARGARGPALPGWTAAPFFFRSADVPLLESTYVVRAHEDAGLVLDVHNGMEGAPIDEEGPWRTVALRRTDVPALVTEPLAPSGREFLPWVQVGAGADEGRLFPYFADSLATAALPTLDVRRWAREATKGVEGDRLAIVRALYASAMEAIEGSDASFRNTAAAVLASGRGNRALLLKAALDALGIEARWAAVRTFDRDPAAYRFPEPNRWGHVVLAVRTAPDAPWTWLDPTTRWAPFGSLSPRARDVSAWILPQPGSTEALRTRTPEEEGPRGREVELHLALDEAGTLRGEGVERYLGWDGAVTRSSLERVDDARLRQVVESSLARAFPGVVLATVEKAFTDAGMELRYAFEQPGAARDLGEGRRQLRLEAFQADLGRRYLARATRETPLLIASPERVRMELELELPAGATIERGVEAARERSPYGDHRRDVGVEGGRVAIREALDLHRGRVPPEAYPAFAAWVSAVDRAQRIDLTLRLPEP